MWCKECRQDVPGIISDDSEEYCCPRCGEALFFGGSGTQVLSAEAIRSEADQPQAPILEAEVPPSEAGPVPTYDPWEMEEQLRHMERILAFTKPNAPERQPSSPEVRTRLDPAHPGPAGWQPSSTNRPAPAQNVKAPRTDVWLPMVTWGMLSLGLTAFACGGVLLSWSFITDRQELWTVGTPIALAGQIALLIGLILQLDRLWHENRDTAAKLDHVGHRLRRLSADTTFGTNRTPASAFSHSHPPDDPNPQHLLADLKSQLDVLAERLGQSEPLAQHDEC